MLRLSVRARTLIISVLFAAISVGGTSVTSYVIVLDGMRQVAGNTASSAASTASAAMQTSVSGAVYSAAVGGDSGEALVSSARELLLTHLSSDFAKTGITHAEMALYDENLRPAWSSSSEAVIVGLGSKRQLAQHTNRSQESKFKTPNVIAGLVSAVRLGVIVTHVPVTLPGGSVGVLDVVYAPVAEEAVLERIRWPMIGLAFVSMLFMTTLMQLSMWWVLGLVDHLRRAADSIDAGRLHERLPVSGHDEITALAQSVNGLIERLERRSDAQSRFVADASHELATPVAGIRGYTSILRAWGADDPRVRDEAVDAIDRESRRMARLTGDLLNLLHADQGLVLKNERFDLNALSRQQLAMSASRWLEKDIEYVGPDEAPLAMVGDQDRVEDVISILLDNASKYTPVGGRISVITRRRREVATLEVADTGQGIPEKDLPHIFDRFYRSDLSRAAGEGGFGLGLAIAKSIVVSMGGEISAASVEGRGTVFTVRLPRGRA